MRCLVFALALLVLGGCVTEEQEQQIGDEIAAGLNRQLPVVRDPLLNRYIQRIGEQIAAASKRPTLDYQFYIVNSAMVNAFALPGGHIYVTRGLIEQTQSGGELAAVLAHEIGHVAARHGVQKLQRHLRTGSVVSILYELILPGGEPDLLRGSSVQLGSILWSARHSRADEQEADRLAVRYLIKSGVDPTGAVSILQTLLAQEAATPQRTLSWFSTHPLTQMRIEAVQQEIGQRLTGKTAKSAPPRREFTSYPAFLRRIAALPPPMDLAPAP